MGVTKTDFVRGLQCPKMLWLDCHRPQEKEIPPVVQKKLDLGNAFGDRAMGMFGEYVETTTYRPDGRLDYAEMLKKTERYLLAQLPVICEAAFSWQGNYCAADILKKTPGGYELYEVKNAASPRKEFLVDLGFQRFLIRRCGVNVEGCFLVLRGAVTPYKIVEATAAARSYERLAEQKIRVFGDLKKQDAEPEIPPGPQCDAPYRCWYYDYCRRGGLNAGAPDQKERTSSDREDGIDESTDKGSGSWDTEREGER